MLNALVKHIRPVHTWWLAVILFMPSVLIWAYFLGLFIYKDMFEFSFDWRSIRHFYLPLLAAILGCAVPLICLRLFKHTSWCATSKTFAGFLAVMLTWAAVDIRCEHYQMGGHEYPNGPLVDGHRYYWHSYFTWYFMPYRWIEQGIKG